MKRWVRQVLVLAGIAAAGMPAGVLAQGAAGPENGGQAGGYSRLANGLLTPQAAGEMGDFYGGRAIPPEIAQIIADPRIDPVTAYMLRQAARRPIGDWSMQEASNITQVIPTLVESGIAIVKLQALYKFLGLDPENLFEPQLSAGWQQNSTSFSAPNYAATSSTDCQADPSMMTVSVFMACAANSPDGSPN